MTEASQKKTQNPSTPDPGLDQPPSEEQGPHISVDEIIEQSSRPEPDNILRQMLRGDESAGDPNERDVAGAVGFYDTPHGREERSNEIERGLDTE